MKAFDVVGVDLQRALAEHEQAKAQFALFCTSVMQLNDADFPVKGVAAELDAAALRVRFLDRIIRISMRFDRGAAKGVLHAEDVSAPDRPGKTIVRIAFDTAGGTSIAGGNRGTTMSLGMPADCKTILLNCVDRALGMDPWSDDT